MNEPYQKWYKCIGNNGYDKTIGVEVEVEVEIEIGGWGMQGPKGLMHLIDLIHLIGLIYLIGLMYLSRKLELDK